jgi:hypothetical protein
MRKAELVSQTKLAFDFIQKLYFEVSYLIKEMEGLLSQESEEFIMGRPSGYAITARSSNGLEAVHIPWWMYRRLSVFFIPKSCTLLEGGMTKTRLASDPRIIYLRILLDDKDFPEPVVLIGVLQNFISKRKSRLVNVEHVMTHIEYREGKVFSGSDDINYDDTYITFKGKLIPVNLYDINTSQDITEKLVQPVLAMYRS